MSKFSVRAELLPAPLTVDPGAFGVVVFGKFVYASIEGKMEVRVEIQAFSRRCAYEDPVRPLLLDDVVHAKPLYAQRKKTSLASSIVEMRSISDHALSLSAFK